MKSMRVSAILAVLPLLQLNLPATANTVNLPVVHSLPQTHVVQTKPLTFTTVQSSNAHVNSASTPTKQTHNHTQQQQTILHQQFMNTAPTSASSGASTAFVAHTGQTPAQSQLLNLDLSSSAANISPSFINQGSITIHIGKTDLVVTPGMLLTPAEAAAAYGVLTTGHQGLILNDKGVATGGSMVLSAKLSTDVDGLDIPKGVVVVDQLSGKESLDLNNGLTNNGHLYLDSLGSAKSSLTILTNSIINSAGAVIGADTHASNAAKAFDTLTLDSTGAFVNGGTISSPGSLQIAANNIENSGHISAVQNISEQNNSGNNLTIGGSGQTTAGGNLSISVQSTGGANNNNGQAALTIINGTYTGKQINFSVPDGALNVNAHELNGGINVLAGTSNIQTHAGNMNVLTLNVNGDPTMSGPGDITVSGGAVANLTVIAGGNIVTSGPGTINTTQAPHTGTIDLEAGVDSAVTNFSTTGGNIELSSLSAVTDGSNVTLVSTSGTVNPGTIAFGSITTTSTTAVTPDAGNITVTAASTTTLGGLNAVGYSNDNAGTTVGGNGGNVTVNVASGNLTISGAINVSGGNGGVGINGIGGVGGNGGNGGNGKVGMSGLGGPGLGGQGGAGGRGGPDSSLAASGSTGTNGVNAAVSPGQAGLQGSDAADGTNGFDGGSAGSVTLKAPGTITAKDIVANGGNGGLGGNGGQGGAGGSGGAGGGYDSNLEGDDGAAGASGGDGGKGGSGGDGGKGGSGGTITITAGTSFTTTGGITATGGTGGSGGTGGFGGGGGNGGFGGFGGLGSPGQNNVMQGSKGGDGGGGGDGGDGGGGGDGGDGGKGGDAGDAGQLTINSGASAIVTSITMTPGSGGAGGMGGAGGVGGFGNNGGGGNKGGIGGNGGAVYQADGSDGQGGTKYLVTSYYGGDGGAGGAGGDGGKGGDGGGSGDGGDGGAAGAGGHLTIDVGTVFSGTSVTLSGGIYNTGGPGGTSFPSSVGNGGGSGGNYGAGGQAGVTGASGMTSPDPPPSGGTSVGVTQPGPPPNTGAFGTGGNGAAGGDSGDGGNGGDGGMGGVGGTITVIHGNASFAQSMPNIGPSANGKGGSGSIASQNVSQGGLTGGNGGRAGAEGMVGNSGANGGTAFGPNTQGSILLENGATLKFDGQILRTGAGFIVGGLSPLTPTKHTPTSSLPSYASKWFSQSSSSSNANAMIVANVHAFDAAFTPSTNSPSVNSRSIFNSSPDASSTSTTPASVAGNSKTPSNPIKSNSISFTPTILIQRFDETDNVGDSVTSNTQSSVVNNAAELFGTMFGGASPIQIGLAGSGMTAGSTLNASINSAILPLLTNTGGFGTTYGSNIFSETTDKSANLSIGSVDSVSSDNGNIANASLDSDTISGGKLNLIPTCDHPDYLTGSVEKTESNPSPGPSPGGKGTELIEGNYLYSGFAGKLDTPLGQLTVAKDAVVFVSYQASRLVVYNLSSGRSSSVIFRERNNQTIPLPVGRQFLVSENKGANFDDLNPCKEMPTWSAHERFSDHLKIYEAEFSIAHAMVNIPHLRQKLHSSNADDGRVINRVLKTAALLAVMNPPNLSAH